eukprot:COSAG02_NODE_1174_length_14082_cov_1929.950154_4_plen_69_part_00
MYMEYELSVQEHGRYWGETTLLANADSNSMTLSQTAITDSAYKCAVNSNAGRPNTRTTAPLGFFFKAK